MCRGKRNRLPHSEDTKILDVLYSSTVSTSSSVVGACWVSNCLKVKIFGMYMWTAGWCKDVTEYIHIISEYFVCLITKPAYIFPPPGLGGTWCVLLQRLHPRTAGDSNIVGGFVSREGP